MEYTTTTTTITRGFNVQVERYCQLLAEDQQFERASTATISDLEMVRRYEKMKCLPVGRPHSTDEGQKKKKKR